jgi:beta-glucanase (GH16 family)
MKHIATLLFCLCIYSAQAQVFDTLVWADEFNVDGPLDSAKWWHQTILPNNGQSWWNGEIQHYTNRDTNSYCDSGFMYLTARKETFTDQNVTKDYTSARLNSKYAFTYGRVEVRAQLPTGVGTWPAIWMLGQNIYEVGAWWQTQGYATTGWPACGEIDIMEHWGHNQDHISSAMHTPSSFGGTVNVGSRYVPGVSNSMHVYALEWTPTKMVFSVDSIVHYTYEPATRDANTWPFDNPQYILMNIAIQSSIDTAFTESPMIVDYIRVYQSSALSTEELEEASIEVFPNPAHSSLTVRQPWSRASASVYSLDGKLLLREAVDFGTNTLDISALPNGNYVVRVGDEESDRGTAVNFVKQD